MSEAQNDAPARRHWSTKARLILAGIAVLGVGAAITTAAWTDDVFFEADATAAGSVGLQGCVGATVTLPGCTGGLGWLDSEDGSQPGTSIDLSYEDLDLLIPGQSQTFQIAIRNLGTGPATLTSGFTIATAPSASALEAACGSGVAADWTVDFTVPPALAATPANTGAITVTVAPPTDWDDSCSGWTGWIVLNVHGEAVA